MMNGVLLSRRMQVQWYCHAPPPVRKQSLNRRSKRTNSEPAAASYETLSRTQTKHWIVPTPRQPLVEAKVVFCTCLVKLFDPNLKRAPDWDRTVLGQHSGEP